LRSIALLGMARTSLSAACADISLAASRRRLYKEREAGSSDKFGSWQFR